MKPSKISIALVIAVLAAAAGCPKKSDLSNQDRLLKRVAGYHDALTWRDWQGAAKFVAPESRSEFQAQLQRLDRKYTLDTWVVRDVRPADAAGKVAVVVYRTFLLSPSVTLQSESVLLTWVLIKREWYLEGPPF